MAARFSGEASFAALVAETQATQGGGGAVESLDDVQTAHAAATSKRVKLVRVCVWMCVCVGTCDGKSQGLQARLC